MGEGVPDRTIPRFSIILTHDRPELLRQCIDAIEPQSDLVLVIDNASNPLAVYDGPSLKVKLLHIPDQPPNLSALWNRGFRWLAAGTEDFHSAWDIAVLCDDTVPSEGWYEAVSTCMRQHGCVAGSTHQWYAVSSPVVKTGPDGDLAGRMCGWAFMVAGEKKLMADEDLKWWWADTEMDWRARSNGGMVICPGPVVHNIHPNDFTVRIPELNHQSGVDGETFARKHGNRPW